MTAFGLASRPWRLVERNVLVARRTWYVFVSGALEPFLFLFSVGVGVGALIDDVTGPGGVTVSYREFVAPAMLAASAMTAVVVDTTISFFVRFKYYATYDSMLATPMRPTDIVRGELLFSLGRTAFYSSCFVITMWVMGLLASWWSVLLLPTALLIGFAFGGVGLAAATWLRSWLDFDFIFIATIPLFLFSATFFPLGTYPRGLQFVVQLSPLYHGADLTRRLTLGQVGLEQLVSAMYLVAMGWIGLLVAQRRIVPFLQP